MSDAIAGALIGAGASIVVTLININAQRVKSTADPSGRTTVAGEMPKTSALNNHKKIWMSAILLLLVWIIVTPFFMGHDFAGVNILIAGGLILLLSIIKPINPLTPFTLTLAMGLLAFLMEPIVKYIKLKQSVAIFGPDVHWDTIIAMIVGAAILNAVVDYFRLKQFT
jgi:hypothetical protein